MVIYDKGVFSRIYILLSKYYSEIPPVNDKLFLDERTPVI